ncbi:CGLAU_01105 family protein [Corynebacterium timonense]|uniref:Uncharacterized protein n=1 Tax=Corynebacterium timonense TaxID=441500 RepID=A0A1H1TAG3_9CORY|nr:CGLAU_01105 family protein [Corynebacterium timonense]SDS57163.1 hypothetical protein SAMN04488539_1936 [Corynebacterium timonense]
MASDYTPHNDVTGNFDKDDPNAPKAEVRGEAGDSAPDAAVKDSNAEDNGSDTTGSLMDNLKSAGEAWLLAGSALGNVASHFVDTFRADRESDAPQGAHAKDDGVDSSEGIGERLKAAVDNARSAFNSSENDRDFRAAATSFASDAEDIFRDYAGSASRAGDATVKSPQTEDAKAAFKDAVAEVRETFNQAVKDVRNRADESDVDAEGAVNEMRSRLDALIAKVSDQFDRGEGDQGDAGAADDDIVEGEVVDETTPSTDTDTDTDHTTNQRAGE